MTVTAMKAGRTPHFFMWHSGGGGGTIFLLGRPKFMRGEKAKKSRIRRRRCGSTWGGGGGGGVGGIKTVLLSHKTSRPHGKRKLHFDAVHCGLMQLSKHQLACGFIFWIDRVRHPIAVHKRRIQWGEVLLAVSAEQPFDIVSVCGG